MAVRMYIGGLPPSVTPEDLAQRFKSFGDVESAELAPDKVYPPPRPGAEPMRFPRNFGFVSIVPKDEKSLQKAVAAYNGSAWRGSTLRCKVAKPAGPDRIAAEKVQDEEDSVAAAATALDPIPMVKEGITLNIKQPYRKKLVTVVLGGSEVVEERLDGGGDAGASAGAAAAAVLDYKGPDLPEAPRKTFEEHLREVRERQGSGEEASEEPGAGASTAAVLAYLDQQAEAMAERKRLAREARQQAFGTPRVAIPPPTSLQLPAGQGTNKRPAAGDFEAAYAEMNQAPPAQRIRTVDFLSDTDLQGLSSRPVVDLSRFGSDSDEEGPTPPRRAVIPQFDGAGDSSSSSDSDSDSSGSSSESESGSGSDGSSSSSSDDEDAGKKVDKESSGSSSDESSGDGDGAGKKRQRETDSDGSSSDSETSSDETATGDAERTETPANEAARQGPGEDAAWMAGRLPAGAAFYRTEPVVQVEAAWRAGRESATREVKERRRQALRQAGGGKRKT